MTRILGGALVAAAMLAAAPAIAGKADFYVEITASNVERVLVATSPEAAQKHTVVRGQTRQFKLQSIETTDDKSEVTVQPGSHFPLFADISNMMGSVACEIKSPTAPITIVNNGGDALIKTKVTAAGNGCQVEKTFCEGAACKK